VKHIYWAYMNYLIVYQQQMLTEKRSINQSTHTCCCHPVISKRRKCCFWVVIVCQHIIKAILCKNSTCTSNTTNNLKSKNISHLCYAWHILLIQSQINHPQNASHIWLTGEGNELLSGKPRFNFHWDSYTITHHSLVMVMRSCSQTYKNADSHFTNGHI